MFKRRRNEITALSEKYPCWSMHTKTYARKEKNKMIFTKSTFQCNTMNIIIWIWYIIMYTSLYGVWCTQTQKSNIFVSFLFMWIFIIYFFFSFSGCWFAVSLWHQTHYTHTEQINVNELYTLNVCIDVFAVRIFFSVKFCYHKNKMRKKWENCFDFIFQNTDKYKKQFLERIMHEIHIWKTFNWKISLKVFFVALFSSFSTNSSILIFYCGIHLKRVLIK